MPKMVMNRKYALNSLCGRSVNFEKGVPVWVPPAAVKEALALGAEGVDEKIDPLEVTETGDKTPAPPAAPLSQTEREEKIIEAFRLITTREQRGDFTAQGVPNTRIIGGIVGFDVMRQDVDPLWEEFRKPKE
jgi:hypothetical protein